MTTTADPVDPSEGARQLAYADPPYLGCCGLYGHRHEGAARLRHGLKEIADAEDRAARITHGVRLRGR